MLRSLETRRVDTNFKQARLGETVDYLKESGGRIVVLFMATGNTSQVSNNISTTINKQQTKNMICLKLILIPV